MTASQPPSPPHSTDGYYHGGEGNRPTVTGVKPEPFTPPMPTRSIMSNVTSESLYVSTYPRHSFHESLPVQDTYGDPMLYQTAPGPMYYTPQQVSRISLNVVNKTNRIADHGNFCAILLWVSRRQRHSNQKRPSSPHTFKSRNRFHASITISSPKPAKKESQEETGQQKRRSSH
jgi:hypothetical protein